MISKISTYVFICLLSTLLFSQDYVLVHGWLGNGADWDNTGVENLVASRQPGRILKPSLDGNELASTQSLNLRDFLNNNSVNNGVAVSFSMGGMTTRYHLRRQYDQSLPGRVSQHYTIASPHFGTAVADNIPLATRIGLVGAASILWPGWLAEENGHLVYYYEYYPSAELAWVLTAAPLFDAFLYGIGDPALSDLGENSSAVNYINPPGGANYENNIIKVGIVGTEIDPVVWRLMAGWLEIEEQTVLDLAANVEQWRFVSMINAMFGYFFGNTTSFEEMVSFIVAYVYVINIDWLWQNVVVESTVSDGLVKKTSQEYPNPTALFYANFVSHMEGRDHDNIITGLAQAFDDYAPPMPTAPQITGFTQSRNPFVPGSSGWVTCNATGSSLSYQWVEIENTAGATVEHLTSKSVKVTFPSDNPASPPPEGPREVLTLRCTVTNSAGSDYDSYTVNYDPDGGGCPFVFVQTASGFQIDNNILHRSEFKENAGKDINDLYKLHITPAKDGSQYKLQIRELNDDHSYFERFKLYAIDHPVDTEIGISEDNEIVLYQNENLVFANNTALIRENGEQDGVSGQKGDHLQLTFPEALVKQNIDTYKTTAAHPDKVNLALVMEIAANGSPVTEDEEPPAKDIAGRIIAGGEDIEKVFARRERKSTVIIPFENERLLTQSVVEWNRDYSLFSAALIPLQYKGYRKTELPLLSAAHSGLGEVKERLLKTDRQYAELERSDILTLTFETAAEVEKGWTRDFVLETVGRYDVPEHSYQLLSSSGKESSSPGNIPAKFSLEQNYPNPFNPSTVIRYSIPSAERVTLKVYDMLGREVQTLVSKHQPAGTYSIQFNAGGFSSGLYFYTLQAGNFTETRKMLLMQ